MSRSLDDLQPHVRAMAKLLLLEAEKRGFPLIVTSTLRTFEEQEAIYAKGRTAPGKIVTKAKAGQSIHNYGLAFDVAFKSPPAKDPFADDNPWLQVGEMGKAIGLVWGGDWKFKDRPHFEAHGISWQQAAQMWPKGYSPKKEVG